MQPRRPAKGTSKITKRPATDAPARGARPAPPPAKQNPALIAGMAVGGVALLVGVLFAAGVFGGGADADAARRHASKLSSEAKALVEEGKHAEAIVKYQAALDHIETQHLAEKLSGQVESIKAGIESAKTEQVGEKGAREKWESWKARAEKPGADKKALLVEADGLAPLFARRSWSRQFGDLRLQLQGPIEPPKPAQSWATFLADLEQRTQFNDRENGQWGQAVTALRERAKQNPADGNRVEAKIKEFDNGILRAAFQDAMLTAERMKKKGEDAVKYLTDRLPQFAGTNAQFEYDDLINAIKKK